MARYITKYKGLELMDKGAREQLKKQPATILVEGKNVFLADSEGNKLDVGTELPIPDEVSLVGYAKEDYVDQKVTELINGAPEALDTLKELSDALGGDENFATTIATQIGGKVDKEDGKGLSSNDYTNEEKETLSELDEKVSAFGVFTVYDEETDTESSMAFEDAVV